MSKVVIFYRSVFILLTAILGGFLPTVEGNAGQLHLIDVHMHYWESSWRTHSPAAVIAKMDATGVDAAAVSSIPDDGTQKLHAQAPGRIVKFLNPERQRGDSSWFNKIDLVPYLKKRLDGGGYSGIGEFHLLDPKIVAQSRIQRILDIALKQNLILHAHSGSRVIEALYATRPGLTILWADKGIDTGAILLQKEVDIAPHDTTGSLYFNRLFPMGIDAIVEAVGLIKSGKAPKIQQDDSLATYEPPCNEKYAGIDWSKPAADVYNLIRGCDPQPGAYSTLGGRKVKFYQAELVAAAEEISPGQVISIGAGDVIVALNGGALKVGKMKGEKGAKIAADEFAGEADLKVGMRFGT